MNYWECFSGDYQRDTRELSLAEHGAYFLLLQDYYSKERPLPDDDGKLFRITHAVTDLEKEAVRSVASQFFPVAADGLRHNKRADKMIARAQPRIEAARANGARGGRPKTHRDTHGVSQQDTHRGTQWGTQPGEASPAPAPAPTKAIPLGNSKHPCSPTHTPDVDAERVCKRMREAGCKGASPRNPELIAALAEGVSQKALRDAAALAVSRGVASPFGWAIARARGQLKDREAGTSGAAAPLVERVRRGAR